MGRQLALVCAGPTRVCHTLVAMGMAAALKERGIRVLQCCSTCDEGSFLGVDEPRKDCLSGAPAVHVNPYIMSRGDILDCMDSVSRCKAELVLVTGCQSGQRADSGASVSTRDASASACAEAAKVLGSPVVLVAEVGGGSSDPAPGSTSASQATLAAAAFVAASNVHETVARYPGLDIVGIIAAEVVDPSQLSELSMALSHLGVALPLLGGLPCFPQSTLQHFRHCKGRHASAPQTTMQDHRMPAHDRIRLILPELSNALEDNVDLGAILAATSFCAHSGGPKGALAAVAWRSGRPSGTAHVGSSAQCDWPMSRASSSLSLQEGLNQSADTTGFYARSPRTRNQPRRNSRQRRGSGSSSNEMELGLPQAGRGECVERNAGVRGHSERGQDQVRGSWSTQRRGHPAGENPRQQALWLEDHCHNGVPMGMPRPGVLGAARGVLRVGVAQDTAFPVMQDQMANLGLLRDLGAELEFFSPLSCSSLPPRLSAVLVRGCQPLGMWEAGQLSANRGLVHCLREFSMQGGAIFAEGVGLCLLAESFLVEGEAGMGVAREEEVRKFPMAGLLPVTVHQKGGRSHKTRACMVRTSRNCPLLGQHGSGAALKPIQAQSLEWLEVEALPSSANARDLGVGLELVEESTSTRDSTMMLSACCSSGSSAASSGTLAGPISRGVPGTLMEKSGPGGTPLACGSSASCGSSSSSSVGNLGKGSTSGSGSGSASDGSADGVAESPRSALDLLKTGVQAGIRSCTGHLVQGFHAGSSVLASVPLLDFRSNVAVLQALLDHCRSCAKSAQQGKESYARLLEPRGKRQSGAGPWGREGSSESDENSRDAEKESDFWGWQRRTGDCLALDGGPPCRNWGGGPHLKQNKSFSSLQLGGSFLQGGSPLGMCFQERRSQEVFSHRGDVQAKECSCADCIRAHDHPTCSNGVANSEEGKAFRRSWSGMHGMPAGVRPSLRPYLGDFDCGALDMHRDGRSSLGSLISPRLSGGRLEGGARGITERQEAGRRASSSGLRGPAGGGPRWEENPGLFADGLFLDRGVQERRDRVREQEQRGVCSCTSCQPVRERRLSSVSAALHSAGASTSSLQSLDRDGCGLVPLCLPSPHSTSDGMSHWASLGPASASGAMDGPRYSWAGARDWERERKDGVEAEFPLSRRSSTGALSNPDSRLEEECEGAPSDPWFRRSRHKGGARGRKEGRRSWTCHAERRERGRDSQERWGEGEDLQAVPEEGVDYIRNLYSQSRRHLL